MGAFTVHTATHHMARQAHTHTPCRRGNETVGVSQRVLQLHTHFFFDPSFDVDDPRLALPDSLSTRDRSASEQISTGVPSTDAIVTRACSSGGRVEGRCVRLGVVVVDGCVLRFPSNCGPCDTRNSLIPASLNFVARWEGLTHSHTHTVTHGWASIRMLMMATVIDRLLCHDTSW
jgi:hypothetical protein